MAFSLPYPATPQNGQSLDATPILANETAIAQAIASFDGSQVQAGSISASAFNANINPNTLLSETTSNFVSSGLVWSGDSYAVSLNGSMTSGVLYYGGVRVSVNSVSAHTFTASKDTYIDVDKNANITYNEVSNGGSAPSLTANSIRIAKVVTSTTIAAASSITQIGADSNGVLIWPNGAASAAHLQNPYKFLIYRASALTLSTSGTVVAYDSAVFDTGNNVNLSTGTFTAPVAGFYQFSAGLEVTATGSVVAVTQSLRINGSTTNLPHVVFYVNAQTAGGQLAALYQLAANDTVTIAATPSGNNVAARVNNADRTWFSGFLVSTS